MKKKSDNVIPEKRPFRINIGLIIFVVIFIYLVFNVFTYLTTTHISVYEVEQGTIAENNIFNGLIIRDEALYTADYTGTLNYYLKEAEKVGYGDLVCSIDQSGSISKLIEQTGQASLTLDSSDIEELREQVYDFVNSYEGSTFYDVYSFKESLSSSLNEMYSIKALEALTGDSLESEQASLHRSYADRDGLLLYYIDGYENVTTDTFTDDMFDEAAYQKQSNSLNSTVNSGSFLYKLVTSELWNIVLPIDETTASKLIDSSVVQIRFVKDDKKMYANCELVNKGGKDYLILSLKSSMIRYARDRYVEIELLLSEETGLKIPISSITEKEFYTIPIEYFSKGGDSDADGLLIKSTDADGEAITEYVSPTIYYETDDFYYVDSEDVTAGDIVQKSNSSATYTIGTDTATLKGVYNINKGYAVFKQIDILYQNADYAIIQTGTTYGISLYDHIALDGTTVNENDLIK